MNIKIYDLVKELLVKYPELRDSDKKLIWNVWGHQGLVWSGSVVKEDYMRGFSPESITRCRRKLQEQYPELQSSKRVQEFREKKADQKGTFIYREHGVKK